MKTILDSPWTPRIAAAIGLTALALAFACVWSGCVSMPLTNGVPNLAQVEPGILRGGQPTAAGWIWLKSQGVTNVVKLNTEKEGSDADAEHLGMKVNRWPIPTGEQIIGEPSQLVLDQIVKAITPGTFVHCSHGQDRTGLVIGLYRFWKCGWTREHALSEMKAHKFHSMLNGLARAFDDATILTRP